MTAAIEMWAKTGEVLILGRPAENERCHRCGHLLIDPVHPRILQPVYTNSTGGARYIEHTWHSRPKGPYRFRRLRLWWARRYWIDRRDTYWWGRLGQWVRYSADPQHDDEELP